ncbi:MULTISPECIES: acetate/propionate family kinase [Cysteiniphilum]|uniref:Acetate kinase n=1 Tax=Cysteiniphilum litorale TaxID=2056700 RepID=A0A8J3E922_9GAMM|nr:MULTISPECIES: acetate kinase [Cysteiniphilum]GGG03773.1 acetate kinase [Cysteiniphilum litorale]
MPQYFLVFNCGSSSIKFSLYDHNTLVQTLVGLVDKINTNETTLSISVNGQTKTETSPLNYHQAFAKIIGFLKQQDCFSQIIAIGHRVVHGGHHFDRAVIVTDDVIAKIRTLIPLAPLHNPANLEGIEFCQQHFISIPQIAVFDTAFHQSIPEEIYRYAIPNTLYEDLHIRKYGFHGISHQYIAQAAAQHLSLTQGNFICAHLGNGCSVTAIKNGKSINTSMGFTPLDGLVMGTRSGTIDPGIFSYLQQILNMDVNEINQLLNNQSGLLGLCGLSDMREIEHLIDNPDIELKEAKQAKLALDIFSHRAASFIASYLMYFDQLDGLIFTAGIGQNSALVRQEIINRLKFNGFAIDAARNQNAAQTIEIHAKGSKRIMVLKTDEERMIAQSCQMLLAN